MARTLKLDGHLEQLVEDQLRSGRFADDQLSTDDIRRSIADSRQRGGLREADAVFDAALSIAGGPWA